MDATQTSAKVRSTANTASSSSKSRSSKKNVPDIFPISRTPHRRLDSALIRLCAPVPQQDRSAVGRQGRGARGGRRAARVAAQRVQVLKIAIGHGSNVLAAKDTNLKVLVLAGRQPRAAGLEVAQVLVNDLLGADVARNVEAVALMGNELARGGKVDAARKRERERGSIVSKASG